MTDRLNDLFARYLERRLTPAEKLELMGLWLEPSLQPELQRLISNAWESAGEEEGLTDEELEALFKQLFEKQEEETKIVKMRRWKKWMVAASVTAFLGLGTYFLFFNKTEKPIEIVKVPAKDVEAPKATKATIMLADGRTISVDSLNTLIQSNVQLSKTADGKIVYSGNAEEAVYNTLTNPRGSKVIDMTLSDGSHVWLNAGSSVRYPVAFVGTERNVSITGEAYFEVTHDAGKPFYVTKGDMSVQVLGTHFNVNAYDDEADIKITLLEGSVKVTGKKESKVMKPGEQVSVAANVPLKIKDANIAQVMAWKEGLFIFNSTDIAAMMRQAERWYDIKVSYPKGIPADRFGGTISRNVNLSEFVKILEYSDVKVKIEDKNVMIMK